MTKIAWLTEYRGHGGAWMTEFNMLDKCPNDMNIKIVDKNKFEESYDFYILNNFRTFYPLQLEYLIDSKNYFIYWHDVIDTGKEKFIRKLYQNAKGNIFLSPLHKIEFCTKFDLNSSGEDNCIAPYFDVSEYSFNSDLDRSKEVCWVGSIQHFKGCDNALLWARDNNQVIDFYGKGNPQLINQLQESKYCNYKGFTSNLKKIYPKYRRFIHMPDSVEAFGRSCMEAWLSGCEIIKNDKVGMYSYPEMQKAFEKGNIKEVQNWLEFQPMKFWHYIKDSI